MDQNCNCVKHTLKDKSRLYREQYNTIDKLINIFLVDSI